MAYSLVELSLLIRLIFVIFPLVPLHRRGKLQPHRFKLVNPLWVVSRFRHALVDLLLQLLLLGIPILQLLLVLPSQLHHSALQRLLGFLELLLGSFELLRKFLFRDRRLRSVTHSIASRRAHLETMDTKAEFAVVLHEVVHLARQVL